MNGQATQMRREVAEIPAAVDRLLSASGDAIRAVAGEFGGRARDVGGHFKVEANGLPDRPFPVVDTDHGVDAQIAYKNDIHCQSRPTASGAL